MKVITTEISGLLIFEPQVFDDDRGWFMESFNQKYFDEAVGEHVPFVQDNHSLSKKGVLRGLHFQRQPHAQGKLVRVIFGQVWDVAVELWIPPGFAHGFVTLSFAAEFLYKTTSLYDASSEGSIVWNDPQLAIEWPECSPVLAAKDAAAPLLETSKVFE